MAKQILMPVGLFPSHAVIAQWFSVLSSLGLSSFREQAYKAYMQKALLEDKELSLFMPFSLCWDQYMIQSARVHFKAPKGIWLKPIEEAYAYSHIKERIVSVLTAHNKSAFELLVYSVYNQAYVLYIPKGTQSQEPISIEHIQTELGITLSVLIVIVEPEAQITLIKKTSALQVMVSVMHTFIESDAQVRVIEEYVNDQDASSIEQATWQLSHNALLTLLESVLGGTTLKMTDHHLIGHYAHVEHTMLAAIKKKEKIAQSVWQHHYEKNSTSKVEAKAVLLDEASSFYRGTITIEAEANSSQAEQYHSALMVGKNARTCAIPSLEIKTNEVHCKHGSAAAHIQEEDLWYLLSRGIDTAQAQRLLIEGFLKDNALMTSYGQLGQKMVNNIENALEGFL